MIRRALLLAVGVLAAGCMAAGGSRAQQPAAAVCRPGETDAAARPLPSSLLPAFRRAFGLEHAPAEYVLHTGFVRCAGGVPLGCGIGANLPCGPADTRRDIPGADAWCRENGNPPLIPAYVTGHASIYAWRCEAGRAVPVRQVAHADAQGFVAKYWRKLEPYTHRR